MINLSMFPSDASQRGKKGSESVSSFLSPSNPFKNHFSDSSFSFSFSNASFIAWDNVENRFTFILSSIHLKSCGSKDTDLLTDKGSFFLGRTINSENIPKLINKSHTITFLVLPNITKMVVRRDEIYERESNN